MGLLKKVKKKIFKGAKKLLKGAGKAFGKLMKNKFVKILAIGAALVFTAGAVAGAFPAFASTGFATTLAGNPITGAVFNAGASLTSGLAGAASAATPGAATSAVGSAAEVGNGLSALPSGVASAVGDATAASSTVAAETAANSGGLLTQAINAGKTAAGYIADKPGAAIVAGKIIQAAAAPKQTDELGRQYKRERQNDNRYGVNNYSGVQGLDVTQDLPDFQQVGSAYTGGLLSRVQAQGQQQNSGTIQMPGAYDPAYSAPPPIVYPNGG